jgi:oligoendopeptidase F
MLLELDRRRALALGAIAPLFAALPALAQPAAASTGAAWDLTDLYPNLAAWEAARKEIAAAIPGLTKYMGRLGESAAVLAEALTAQSDLGIKLDRLAVYASLDSDADLRNSEAKARDSQATDLYSTFGEAVSWQAPELVALGSTKIESFIAQSPVLQKRFAFGLRDTLRLAKHVLSPESEQIMAAAEAPLAGPKDIRDAMTAADIPWPTVTLSDGRMQRLDDQGYTLTRDAPNRADRKLVMDTFFGAYNNFRTSLGTAQAAKIKGDLFRAKARGYANSLERSLDGPNIAVAVYRSLIAEANAGLPQLHRYFELRRKLLKLPDMAYYDIYPPLVQLDKKFTLEEMRANTLAATRPLGKDYVAMLADATSKKWMDPRPRPGKQSGASMQGSAYDVHPYLLLNLSDQYDGMTTFAHEWGHAMHSLLARQNQPYELAGYATFTAEIASTANEQLLFQYMLSQAKTKEEKLFYLGQQMENIRGTFFRQAMFGEFELKIHELAEAGEGLSGKKFSEVYYDILKRYHGPNVIIPESYAVEWAYILHFTHYTYYVYQYATSITAGVAFARKILAGGAPEAERYLGVLRAGGSDYPVAILQKAGLDMTTPAPYRSLVAGFKDILDQAEALVG